MDQPAKKETSQIYINLTRFFLNKPIYFFSCIDYNITYSNYG